MTLSLGEIQRRRGQLVERARAERADIEAVLHSHGQVFWLADRGVAMIRLVVANKEIPAGRGARLRRCAASPGPALGDQGVGALPAG
jgi:hypothetical protein